MLAGFAQPHARAHNSPPSTPTGAETSSSSSLGTSTDSSRPFAPSSATPSDPVASAGGAETSNERGAGTAASAAVPRRLDDVGLSSPGARHAMAAIIDLQRQMLQFHEERLRERSLAAAGPQPPAAEAARAPLGSISLNLADRYAGRYEVEGAQGGAGSAGGQVVVTKGACARGGAGENDARAGLAAQEARARSSQAQPAGVSASGVPAAEATALVGVADRPPQRPPHHERVARHMQRHAASVWLHQSGLLPNACAQQPHERPAPRADVCTLGRPEPTAATGVDSPPARAPVASPPDRGVGGTPALAMARGDEARASAAREALLQRTPHASRLGAMPPSELAALALELREALAHAHSSLRALAQSVAERGSRGGPPVAAAAHAARVRGDARHGAPEPEHGPTATADGGAPDSPPPLARGSGGGGGGGGADAAATHRDGQEAVAAGAESGSPTLVRSRAAAVVAKRLVASVQVRSAHRAAHALRAECCRVVACAAHRAALQIHVCVARLPHGLLRRSLSRVSPTALAPSAHACPVRALCPR